MPGPAAAPGTGHASSARCSADWRRPDGYWRCDREAGHTGRHRLQAALDARPIRIARRAGSPEPAVAATPGH